MGTVDDFILSIKKKEGFRFDKQVAELIGVDKYSLANAKLRNKLPNNYIMWYCDNYDIPLDRFDQEIKLTNTEIQLEGEEGMDARYVIELQKEKIEHLNDEIDHLKTTLKEKHAEATHWDALLYDYTSVCTISRKGLRYGRMVNAVDNLEIQSKILGYTKSELNAFWDVGTQYDDFFTHPSDKLYDRETLKDMRRQLSTLPHIFNSLKSMVGDHYIPQPLLFICKDGSLKGAVAYCKVEWWNMIINAKVQFCRD